MVSLAWRSLAQSFLDNHADRFCDAIETSINDLFYAHHFGVVIWYGQRIDRTHAENVCASNKDSSSECGIE